MAVKIQSQAAENTVVEVVDAPNTEATTISLTKVNEIRNGNSLMEQQNRFKQEILASGEIDKLTSTIDISDTRTLTEFGKQPAMEMAKVADQIMSKYDTTAVSQTTQLVDSLFKIMKKIDIGEIQSAKELMASYKKKTIFDKFKQSAEEKLNALVNKYQTVGAEMEKICRQLEIYDQQINESNKDIAKMYEQSINNYKMLTAYVMAGEQAVKEIEEYRDERQREFEQTGSSDIQFELQNINQAIELMKARVADLRGADALALQSVPTFKIQEYTNANLSRKVNSAFIVTVPAFKNAIVQSLIAKQQALQTQGLEILDEANSMLIRQTADNAVQQLQNSQRLANSSAIKADDIEYAWNKIMNGIKEYREQAKVYDDIRKEEAVRIEQANNNYLQSLADGSAI